jgi:D-methionine transport system permease protein
MLNPLLYELITSFAQTIYMVGISGLLSALLGLPLGIVLFTTRSGGLLEHRMLNTCINAIINGTRSLPFIILLIAIIPLTRLIVGTSIGTNAAIVPLTLGAIPFFARLVENDIMEIPTGLIEAGKVMGASPLQIIRMILIPEALPGLINSFTVTLITLVGYSAMAGTVGGGGLGDLAIRYGYQRFDVRIMVITIITLIILVQLVQFTGELISKRYLHR